MSPTRHSVAPAGTPVDEWAATACDRFLLGSVAATIRADPRVTATARTGWCAVWRQPGSACLARARNAAWMRLSDGRALSSGDQLSIRV